MTWIFVAWLVIQSSTGPVTATLTHGPFRSESECGAERLRAMSKLQAIGARVGECEAR